MAKGTGSTPWDGVGKAALSCQDAYYFLDWFLA
jgi:hypothetical protein